MSLGLSVSMFRYNSKTRHILRQLEKENVAHFLPSRVSSVGCILSTFREKDIYI